MTKTEFVAKLAEEHNFAPGYADKILNAFLASIEDGLYKDGRIRLPQFGIFETAAKGPREGRNPASGEIVHIPAGRAIRFKAAKNLRDLLN